MPSPTLRRKLLLTRPLWASYSRRSLFAFCCFLCGTLGTIVSICIMRGPISTYRCYKAGDTPNDFSSSAIQMNSIQSRPKVLGFIGIQTGFGSAERRKALRESWLPSDPHGLLSLEQATGLAFRFVIGRNKDGDKMAEIEKEMDKYRDILRIDIEEDYNKLPYKTLAFFKAAFRLFDADFYVKADDDIYLRPDRLATLLAKERSSPRTYLGCMKKGPVFRDPNLKWYEPLGDLLGNEYFMHAYGPIYALSAEVVAGLSVLRNDSFRMFSNEDVTIGAWMLAMNVNHEDNRELCSPECTSTSIAVWDIPKCSESGVKMPEGKNKGAGSPDQKTEERIKKHRSRKCSPSKCLQEANSLWETLQPLRGARQKKRIHCELDPNSEKRSAGKQLPLNSSGNQTGKDESRQLPGYQ